MENIKNNTNAYTKENPLALTPLTKISHHGAVDGVTGSCHQLHFLPTLEQVNASVLIDCGLFQGAETVNGASAEQLAIGFDVSGVQALIVTHCHIDHVGRIPYLLAAGFTGPIIATEATAALLPLVIEDALKVGVTRNAKIIKACLTLLKKQLVAVPYKKWHHLALSPKQILNPKVGQLAAKVKFQPAGHILGSAYVEIDLGFKSATYTANKNLTQRVVFSGDLGATYAPLLPAPKSPYKADVLVIESTYGDKNHAGRKERSAQLKAVLKRAISDNGVVIIPAFSIGRTQELLYELEHIITRERLAVLSGPLGNNQDEVSSLNNDNKLANIEVIVDSPMAAEFTQYYRKFTALWDKEARNRLSAGRHPLSFDALHTINSHQTHLATINYLASRNKPAIVIAASGMCSGGRVVNYLARFLSDSKADVLFVGYQARGTLGHNIQKYGSNTSNTNKPGYVYIDGKRVDINAGVHTISGYSAHADQNNLVNFVKRMRIKPKEVIVVHGDDKAKAALVNKLQPLVEVVRVGQG
ncbi:MAG: MBL fold metallo-hydrolase RNA specificity domain-containing protein [Thalassotalea sp.]